MASESGGVGEWHLGPSLVRWGDLDALARAVTDRVAFPSPCPRDETIRRRLAVYGRLTRQ